MKKHIFLVGLITSTFVLFTGCSKEDTEAPVIELLGDNPFDLELLENYNDPGATAEDDEDGDLSDQIDVDDSDLENRIPGSYEIFYSVSDAAGNVGSASRQVIVFATNNALARTYTVFDTCGSGASAQTFSYSQVITATGSNTISFNKFADYSGNNGITATVASNGTITLPTQQGLDIGSATEDHEVQGTGSINNVKGFVLNYTDKNNSATPVSTAQCRAWFERQ
jgi:hypothetical protein